MDAFASQTFASVRQRMEEEAVATDKRLSEKCQTWADDLLVPRLKMAEHKLSIRVEELEAEIRDRILNAGDALANSLGP